MGPATAAGTDAPDWWRPRCRRPPHPPGPVPDERFRQPPRRHRFRPEEIWLLRRRISGPGAERPSVADLSHDGLDSPRRIRFYEQRIQAVRPSRGDTSAVASAYGSFDARPLLIWRAVEPRRKGPVCASPCSVPLLWRPRSRWRSLPVVATTAAAVVEEPPRPPPQPPRPPVRPPRPPVRPPGALGWCGDRQDRRDPARLEVVGAVGDRRPDVPRRCLQGRRRAVRHPERRGRQDQDGHHRRPDDHQRRQGPADRQPRQPVGRRHREEGRRRGRQDDRLRPPHPRRHGGRLRLVRQRQGRQAAGRGPRQVPHRQEGGEARTSWS